jgi:ectoine hydroxylase-related dioxygenase (phytanoyl-CoA dioxygenase family)
MISPHLKVTGYQTQLNNEGYSVIPHFLQLGQTDLLKTFFYETLPQSEVNLPFFTTHWSNKKEYRQLVNDRVQGLLSANLSQHFTDFKCVFGYYLFKKPDSSSNVYMHQDWSLTDEIEYTAYILWIPLVDTDDKNGCFKVVPGSHLRFNNPRGTNIEPVHPGVTDADFKSIPIKAGDAIVFDIRLLHASAPNLSGTDRLATGLVILPEQAPVIHYYLNKEQNIATRYQAADTFLVDSYYDYRHLLPADYILSFVHPSNQPL